MSDDPRPPETVPAGHGAMVEIRDLADALARELIAVAPTGWMHIRANFGPSGRGEAFAVTTHGSQWLEVSHRATQWVRSFGQGASVWKMLRLDIDPGRPATVHLESGASPALRLAGKALIGLSVICIVTAAVVAALTVFRPSPPVIPFDVAPPILPAQAEAERLVRDWYDNEKSADPAWLRQLVCATPTGLVAEELAATESGSSRDAQIRIEGFTDFVDNGSTAQIKVYYTGRPLSARAAEQIQKREEGYFIWTFVFTRDAGQLRICGG